MFEDRIMTKLHSMSSFIIFVLHLVVGMMAKSVATQRLNAQKSKSEE